MTTPPVSPHVYPSVAEGALRGLCPECGAVGLFTGPVQFADKCARCGHDFTRYNVGDGPAAFLTLFVGALIVALALIVELAFEPPFWVHVLLWVPLTALAVVGSLRAAKAALLHLEYRNQAREGLRDDESGKSE